MGLDWQSSLGTCAPLYFFFLLYGSSITLSYTSSWSLCSFLSLEELAARLPDGTMLDPRGLVLNTEHPQVPELLTAGKAQRVTVAT